MRPALQPHDTLLLKDLVLNQKATTTAIAKQFNASIVVARRWKRNLKVFGEPYPPALRKRGRPSLLTAEQDEVSRKLHVFVEVPHVDDAAQVLLLYLEDRPTAYLDEVAYFLFDRFGVTITESAIGKHLKSLNWLSKVAKKAALQRNEDLRANWRARRAYWPVDRLVFVDESACMPRTGDRKRG